MPSQALRFSTVLGLFLTSHRDVLCCDPVSLVDVCCSQLSRESTFSQECALLFISAESLMVLKASDYNSQHTQKSKRIIVILPPKGNHFSILVLMTPISLSLPSKVGELSQEMVFFSLLY